MMLIEIKVVLAENGWVVSYGNVVYVETTIEELGRRIQAIAVRAKLDLENLNPRGIAAGPQYAEVGPVQKREHYP